MVGVGGALTAVSSLASLHPSSPYPVPPTQQTLNNAGRRHGGSQMTYVTRTILEKDFSDSSIKDGLEENQQQAHPSPRTY